MISGPDMFGRYQCIDIGCDSNGYARGLDFSGEIAERALAPAQVVLKTEGSKTGSGKAQTSQVNATLGREGFHCTGPL